MYFSKDSLYPSSIYNFPTFQIFPLADVYVNSLLFQLLLSLKKEYETPKYDISIIFKDLEFMFTISKIQKIYIFGTFMYFEKDLFVTLQCSLCL